MEKEQYSSFELMWMYFNEIEEKDCWKKKAEWLAEQLAEVYKYDACVARHPDAWRRTVPSHWKDYDDFNHWLQQAEEEA